MMRKLFIVLALCLVTFYGCVTNPVTGKLELRLVPQSYELQIGSKQYLPSHQMQGGDYCGDRNWTC